MSPELQRGLEKMKAELKEFIELSKTITQSKWGVNHQGYLCIELERDVGGRNAAFIVRSRNISPAMAGCLLVTVKGLENALLHAQAGWTDFARLHRGSPDYDETYQPVYGQDVKSIEDTLQQTLTMWEAAL